ncbi:CdiA C-terminal domain-containing protein [Streptomyces specialis]|uniref:CdiA C-terminal domain-containing protein n=1 Tax=Streptomyces specialis TaxID=498367 RepID=UPI00131C56A7|nr:hypothetical protein [Streptomyces specialis]
MPDVAQPAAPQAEKRQDNLAEATPSSQASKEAETRTPPPSPESAQKVDRNETIELDRTTPSGRPDVDALPRGTPTAIPPAQDAGGKRNLRRENEAAIILAKKGYDIEQNPAVPGGKKPDYRIEGRIFDGYAPSTDKPAGIRKKMRKKVERGQADRIVLSMVDCPVEPDVILRDLERHPHNRPKEVIMINGDGDISRLWPR